MTPCLSDGSTDKTMELRDRSQSVGWCECGDSANPGLAALENPERFRWAVAIECTK
jgi:hypothetical protein